MVWVLKRGWRESFRDGHFNVVPRFIRSMPQSEFAKKKHEIVKANPVGQRKLSGDNPRVVRQALGLS